MNNKNKIVKFIYMLITIISSLLLIIMFLKLSQKQNFINQSVINYSKQKQNNDDSQINNLDENNIDKEIVLPSKINFVFSSLDKLIPENPSQYPQKFLNFYLKLNNNKKWIDFKERNVEFYNDLEKIHQWYWKKFNTPSFAGSFPKEAKDRLIANGEFSDLFNQFKKINNIPENPTEIKAGAKFKYIYPDISNIVNENYNSEENADQFPNLKKFDYKMLVIDTENLEDNSNLFFSLQYSYNNNGKYNIYIRNKNNAFSQDNTIEELLDKGCIIIRKNGKKYKVGDAPELLNDINLTIAKNDNKIEFYTSIQKGQSAKLIVKNNLPAAWENNVKIGLLDYPITPWNISNVIKQGENYSMIPNNNVADNLLGYSEKSDYVINQSESFKKFIVTFYMTINEKITIPIFYKNKQIEGSTNLILITDGNGKLEFDQKVLKIPSDDYDENIEPIEVKHRTKTSDSGKIWIEIKITTDSNIILGSKDILSTENDPIPSEFQLKNYGAIYRDIIFEPPLTFKKDYKIQKINYAKIFDTEKVTKKMIGELYYNAWGINKDKYNFKLSDIVKLLNNDILISQLPNAQFTNNKLTYLKTKEQILDASSTPINDSEIVQNNFGKLLQDINNYYNNLNLIVKKISKQDIFQEQEHNFLKPSIKLQEYKFVDSRLLGKNINDIVRTALEEIQWATEAFINGSDLLPEELKNNKELMNVKRDDQETWTKFALPRIIKIVLNRYSTIFSEFENALLKYKYDEIISKLLESDKSKSNKNYRGINSKIISNKNMKIGPKKQNMLIVKKGIKITNFNNFKEQLQTILHYFSHNSNILKNILDDQDYESFLKNSPLLLKDKKTIDDDKKMAYKQIKFLFKILDFYIRKEKYSLQQILDIGYFIENEKRRMEILINNFNNAVTNLVDSRKVYVSAYAFKALVEYQLIEIAEINIKKIFDSFLSKTNLSKKEKNIIKSYKDFDYSKKPNKLFEIAVKIGEFNFNKFLNNITGNDINGTAEKILKLDPLLQLPSNLPAESRFTDIIKGISKKPDIIYMILGILTLLLGVMIAAIGVMNKRIIRFKMGFMISIGLIVAGIATLVIILVFPPIGNLALIIG